MKYYLLLIGLLVSSFVSAERIKTSFTAEAVICNKGCYVYNHACVCDILPNTADPVQPSDEVAPKNKMPSYQREGVVIVDIPSCAAEDRRQDLIKAEAEAKGKEAAGIKWSTFEETK